jgi:rod shape-determining protein MreC
MQGFLDFLRKYSRFLLFLFLQILCLLIVLRNNEFQRVFFLNTANAFTGTIYERVAGIREYFSLRKSNELLAEENAQLRAQLLKDKYKIYSGSVTTKDTMYKQVFSYIPAKIINNSVDRTNNYITLNVGRIHGVRPDMGVMSGNGIVGIVKTVSDHFSVAMSLLHTKSKVTARLKGSREYFGPLEWKGRDPGTLILDHIPSSATIGRGDTIETTGYSSIFPEGIMVGVVKDFKVNSDEGYFTVEIAPSCDFRTVKNVYVVNYLLKDEQNKAEQEAAADDEQ